MVKRKLFKAYFIKIVGNKGPCVLRGFFDRLNHEQSSPHRSFDAVFNDHTCIRLLVSQSKFGRSKPNKTSTVDM